MTGRRRRLTIVLGGTKRVEEVCRWVVYLEFWLPVLPLIHQDSSLHPSWRLVLGNKEGRGMSLEIVFGDGVGAKRVKEVYQKADYLVF